MKLWQRIKRRLWYATGGYSQVEEWREGYERVFKQYRDHMLASASARTSAVREYNKERARILSIVFGWPGKPLSQ